MGKGLIIGLASLGVGLAAAGGVGGYFINDAINKTPITKEENVAVAEESYTDYDFPEEFNYTSHTVYDIGENFAMFSSQSIGMYMLNKETKAFTFFNSSYVSSVSKEVNGHRYFWLNNNNMFKVNAETGESEIVALNSGVAFSGLYFKGYSGDKILMTGYSSSGSYSSNEYYFLAYDTIKGTSDVYSITSNQYNYVDVAIDFGSSYYLSRIYNTSSGSSTSTYDSYLLNKTTKEAVTVTSYYLYKSNGYFVKDDKVYAILKKGSSNCIATINLSTGAVAELESITYNIGTFYEYEKGLMLCQIREINGTNYGSQYYAYYVSFEDDSVIGLTFESEDKTYTYAYEINNILVFTPYTTSSGRYAKLALFNEETKQLEMIYTSLVSSSSSWGYCSIYEYEGKYYVSSDNSNYTLLTVTADGKFNFKRINLKCSVLAKKYEIAENQVIFETDGLKYYDFENDIYKSLLSGSSSSTYKVEKLETNGNIVTIYVSNNIKYEFNLTTLSFKAIAHWE
ncbi:MAG: hypothetical protein ACI4R8_03690 [Candidatus Caccovivens sp.]